MTDAEIITNWKRGLTIEQLSKEYMKEHNKKTKKGDREKIKIMEAMSYVEPIIFEYETRSWKK